MKIILLSPKPYWNELDKIIKFVQNSQGITIFDLKKQQCYQNI